MKSICRCGKTWAGMKAEHCAACHETFTGTYAGDLHRVGKHAVSSGPDRRRCMTEDEMLARGMTKNAKDMWTLGGKSPWA